MQNAPTTIHCTVCTRWNSLQTTCAQRVVAVTHQHLSSCQPEWTELNQTKPNRTQAEPNQSEPHFAFAVYSVNRFYSGFNTFSLQTRQTRGKVKTHPDQNMPKCLNRTINAHTANQWIVTSGCRAVVTHRHGSACISHFPFSSSPTPLWLCSYVNCAAFHSHAVGLFPFTFGGNSLLGRHQL